MMAHRVNILLVDDRPENLLALEAILEPLGQNMIRADSGPEALKQVLGLDFAVILLDVQMPGMNGFEVAEIIKSRERSRTIVAVFVELCVKQRELQNQGELLRESQKRELELEHRTSLLEAEARSAAKLSQMNDELHRRQVALEQAMGARNRFYASMSHELRTPINAVIGYSTIMLDNIYGPLNAKQKEGLQRTLKAARHLLELVNDVLDLSKIEAGKIELSLQQVMFPSLIEDLFVTVRPLADEYGSTLSLDTEGEHFSIVSDPRRVRQIMLNLLSNAIKFGEGKPIRVLCKQNEDGSAQIEVIDQGLGIEQDDIARIFEEFVQVSESKQPGTGLGLPISRRLAQLLDGSLTVRSVPGEGSAFRLTLPASLEDDATSTAELSEATVG